MGNLVQHASRLPVFENANIRQCFEGSGGKGGRAAAAAGYGNADEHVLVRQGRKDRCGRIGMGRELMDLRKAAGQEQAEAHAECNRHGLHRLVSLLILVQSRLTDGRTILVRARYEPCVTWK